MNQFDYKTTQKVVALTLGQDRVTVTLGNDSYPSDTEVAEDAEDYVHISVFNHYENIDKELLELTPNQAKLVAAAILELLL